MHKNLKHFLRSQFRGWFPLLCLVWQFSTIRESRKNAVDGSQACLYNTLLNAICFRFINVLLRTIWLLLDHIDSPVSQFSPLNKLSRVIISIREMKPGSGKRRNPGHLCPKAAPNWCCGQHGPSTCLGPCVSPGNQRLHAISEMTSNFKILGQKLKCSAVGQKPQEHGGGHVNTFLATAWDLMDKELVRFTTGGRGTSISSARWRLL